MVGVGASGTRPLPALFRRGYALSLCRSWGAVYHFNRQK